MGRGSRRVSFVGRLSLSRRVLYWRFHCSYSYSPTRILELLVVMPPKSFVLPHLYSPSSERLILNNIPPSWRGRSVRMSAISVPRKKVGLLTGPLASSQWRVRRFHLVMNAGLVTVKSNPPACPLTECTMAQRRNRIDAFIIVLQKLQSMIREKERIELSGLTLFQVRID